MEAVGAVDDEAHPSVRAFVTGVVHPRRIAARMRERWVRIVFAETAKGFEPGQLAIAQKRSGALDLALVKVAFGDCPKRSTQAVGAPDRPARDAETAAASPAGPPRGAPDP